KRRGHDDARTVDQAVDRAHIGEGATAEAPCRFCGALTVGVHHGDQLDVVVGGVLFRVVPAEVADPHDGGANAHSDRSRMLCSLMPTTAMLASSARAISSPRSSKIVRPA